LPARLELTSVPRAVTYVCHNHARPLWLWKFAAGQAIAVLRRRNIEVAPLLRRVGLSERDFDNRHRRISAIDVANCVVAGLRRIKSWSEDKSHREGGKGRPTGRLFVHCNSPRAQLWQSSKGAQPSVEFGEILAQEWRKFNIIPLDESATT
jgi:hypothetical protein